MEGLTCNRHCAKLQKEIAHQICTTTNEELSFASTLDGVSLWRFYDLPKLTHLRWWQSHQYLDLALVPNHTCFVHLQK